MGIKREVYLVGMREEDDAFCWDELYFRYWWEVGIGGL